MSVKWRAVFLKDLSSRHKLLNDITLEKFYKIYI